MLHRQPGERKARSRSVVAGDRPVLPKGPGRRRSDRLLIGQTRILERVALGKPLKEILTDICFLIEEHTPEVLCSILLLDEEGKQLHHGAAPSLPSEYCEKIDGLAIGPSVGSCGTAAFRAEQVIVSDIASDPLWVDYRDLALEHELRACWSTPIMASSGQVLGTFAMYYREARSPEPQDLQLVADATHLVGIAVERVSMDQALRRSELRYRTVVETAGNAIVCLNAQKRIIEWNAAADRLFGYRRTEALDEDYLDLCLLSGDRRSVGTEIERILAGGPATVLEHPVRIRGGTTRTVSWTLSSLVDATGVPYGVVAIGQDMTDRQRAEEAIRRTQKLESLGVLAGGVARDLDRAVTSVLRNIRLVRPELPSESPGRAMIDRIRSAAEQAAELSNQLLAFAGTEQGSLHALFVNRLVDDMRHILEAQLCAGARLHYELPHEVPPIVGDPAKLEQVISNLVANASDAVRVARGTITVSVGEMQADRAFLEGTYPGGDLPEGPYVYLRVADTGRGMEASVQSKMFDPFFSTKPDRPGLGLAAVLGIVRAHRGTIDVLSEVNNGTTMTVILPLPSRQD